MTTPTPTPEQSAQARANALVEYEANAKQPLIMWLLWLFLGGFGAHRFYLGDTKKAVFMLITCMLLVGFIWVLVDAFMIQGELKSKNRALWADIATRYGAPLEPYPASAA